MAASNQFRGIETFICTLTEWHANYAFRPTMDEREFNTDVAPHGVRLPPDALWKLELRPDQVQSLAWMQSFEDTVARGDNYLSVPRWFHVRGTDYVVLLDARFLVHTEALTCSYAAPNPLVKHVFYRGGVLADKTGSGKTAVVLALVASTAGRELGGLTQPSRTDSSSSSAPPPVWFPPRIPSRLSSDVFSASLAMLPVKATLIIVPMNLSKQWLGEISKFLRTGEADDDGTPTPRAPARRGARGKTTRSSPSVNVLALFNKRHYAAATVADVLAADIVLTTPDFLLGRAYPSNAKTPDFYTLRTLFLKYRDVGGGGPVPSVGTTATNAPPPPTTPPPPPTTPPPPAPGSLHLSPPPALVAAAALPVPRELVILRGFRWKRVIFDEQHIAPSSPHAWKSVLGICAQVYWGVTATPTLGAMGDVWRIHGGSLPWPALLTRRTIRLSPFVQPLAPIVVSEHWVDVNAREREILETYRHEGLHRLVQLCTCFGVLALFTGGAGAGVSGGGGASSSSSSSASIEELQQVVCMTFEELSRFMVTRRAAEIHEQTPVVDHLQRVIATDKGLLEHIESQAAAHALPTRTEGAPPTPTPNPTRNSRARAREEEDGEDGGGAEGEGEEEAGAVSCDSSIERVIKRRIKVNERKLALTRDKLNVLMKQCTFFKTQIELDHNHAERTCPICITHPACVITKCGHWFCADCVATYKSSALPRQKTTCPMCKVELLSSEWILAVPPAASREVAEDESDGEDEGEGVGEGGGETETAPAAADRYGSKLAAIVEFLREVKSRGEKAIMFVQWTELLRTLRATLSAGGVAAVALIGNTNSRNAAIDRMKNGAADVLLLSMECSNTGLNLTEANHVIFAHALVGGSPTTQYDCIAQAVARVHRVGQQRQVHVHWFITRDTDEQRLFAANRLALRP
jgi:hypothetical protein